MNKVCPTCGRELENEADEIEKLADAFERAGHLDEIPHARENIAKLREWAKAIRAKEGGVSA